MNGIRITSKFEPNGNINRHENGTNSGTTQQFDDETSARMSELDDKMDSTETPATASNSIWTSLQESITLSAAIVVAAMALGFQVIPATQSSHASYAQIAVLGILGTVFYSFVFRVMILSLSETALGRKQCQNFQLKKQDVYDICVKSVSALQALLSCVIVGLALQEACCSRFDDFSAYSWWIDFYTWFGLPYFLYDVVVMYKAYSLEHINMDIPTFILQNKIMFLHHVYIPTIGLLGVQALRRRFGDCVFMFLYSMEFSTIFVNIRLILHRLRMTSSPWYVLNGVLMLISFFICRIWMIPHLIFSYSKMFHLTLLGAVMSIPVPSIVSIVVFMTLQVYWMALMIRVAVRLLRQNVRRLVV